jgi:threonine dehydrogenase-like Zn-dependent dehydrogenase
VEPNRFRRELSGVLGASIAVDATEDGIAEILDWTDSRGADLVIEAVGGPQVATFETAMGLAGRGGRVVVLGEFTENRVPLDVQPLKKREIDVLGSVGHPQSFEPVIDLLAAGTLDPTPLVTHVVPLDGVPGALELLDSQGGGVVKVVMSPSGPFS